jgi:hypothetical protein
MGSAGGAIDSRIAGGGGGGGRLLFAFAEGAEGGPNEGGGGGLGMFPLDKGDFGGAIDAGRGAGVGTRNAAGDGINPEPGFLVISKSGFVPAGGGGIDFERAAAASTSARTIAAIVMPLGNVSVRCRGASSSSVPGASSTGAFGRGVVGLPKAPVGNFGAGGIVGDWRGTTRGALGTTSDCDV